MDRRLPANIHWNQPQIATQANRHKVRRWRGESPLVLVTIRPCPTVGTTVRFGEGTQSCAIRGLQSSRSGKRVVKSKTNVQMRGRRFSSAFVCAVTETWCTCSEYLSDTRCEGLLLTDPWNDSLTVPITNKTALNHDLRKRKRTDAAAHAGPSCPVN